MAFPTTRTATMTVLSHLQAVAVLCLSLLASTGSAEESIIPTAILPLKYHAVWDHSPFTREVIKPVETVAENPLNQSWVLEGLIEDDQVGYIAYVRDLATQDLMVIRSQKSDDHPLVIVSADNASDPGKAKVKVYDGSKSTEIGFAVSSLTSTIAPPKISSPATSTSSKRGERPASLGNKTPGSVPFILSPKGKASSEAVVASENGDASDSDEKPTDTAHPNSTVEPTPANLAKDKRARKLRILPER